MYNLKLLIVTAFVLLVFTVCAMAGSVSMKISGPGAVNDSTIQAGKEVSLDIYVSNDSMYTGFSFGFTFESPDIKKIIHVSDSLPSLNENGDIKGHNGWEDRSTWNFGGVYAVEKDWDGVMPELLGFGGLSIQQEYKPHDIMKVISANMVFTEAGTISIDSAFYPPGGGWMFANPSENGTHLPKWGGPYTFKVVK